MFSEINFHSRIDSILRYNEKKVSKDTARLIHASGFLNNPERLSYQEKYYRFLHLNEMNQRTKVNMMHISLGFDPSEKPTKDELSAIADKYMTGMGFKDQPYLVYEHYDATHAHMHIVTNLIRRDGSRIHTFKMGQRLSVPVCKEIAKEYDLVQSDAYKNTVHPISQTMSEALQKVNSEYKFTSFIEYNAVLKQYGVNAYRGRPESYLYQKKGLLYLRLDDKGLQIGAPIKASSFSFKPTVSFLDQKFEESRQLRKEDLSSIQKRVDWTLSQHSSSLRDFVDELRNEDIEVVISNDGRGSNLVFVDNRSRTAVDASSFGKGYEAGTILDRFYIHEKLLVPGFNSKVPQILSALLKHDQAFARSPHELSEEQEVRHRHRL